MLRRPHLCNLLGVTLLDSDADGYDAETEHAKLADAIEAAPVKALFYAVYCNYGDSAGNSYHQHYYGTHRENNSLNRLYDLLEVLGYKLSDEEKAMRDGTHELFGTDAEPETDTGSEMAA